jgi:hypothetical protein
VVREVPGGLDCRTIKDHTEVDWEAETDKECF